MIEFKADTEGEAQYDNKFVIGDANGKAGIMTTTGEANPYHSNVTSTFDQNGAAKFDFEIEANSAKGTIIIIFSNAAGQELKVENTIPKGSESITMTFKTVEGEKPCHVRVGENFTTTEEAE